MVDCQVVTMTRCFQCWTRNVLLHDSVSIATYYHKHAEISSKTFSALENEPLITIMRALAKALESVQHESTFGGLSDIDHSRCMGCRSRPSLIHSNIYVRYVRTTCAY